MGQSTSFLPVHTNPGLQEMLEGVVGNGTPRKFPSPEGDNGDGLDEHLVMSSIPIHPVKYAENGPQHKIENIGYCNFVINHEGRFKVLWDWMILVLVMYTAIQIPYYAAFSNFSFTILDDENRLQPIVILSLLVDCMFLLDIFLNFRTTYIESTSDIVETKPKKLAIYYLKTWFIIDMLAAIPFDWIIPRGGGTSDLVGLLKSARLLRLFRVARKLDRYSEYGIAVLFLLMCLFTLIAHWFACIWNAIAASEERNPNSWVQRMHINAFVMHHNESSHRYAGNITESERYVAALYFIVSSMTSVGFGNISATTQKEQIFSIVIMLAGALMYACIFGNMVAIVQRLYSKASTFHSHINTVREFMKFYKIPEELRNSINNYIRREWNASQGVDAELVLQRFPECIQADLTYELYHHVFHNTKPFREATVSCMRALAMKFKTITLQQNNYPIRQGEELNKIYVVGKGALEVLVDGALVSYLTRYCTFGYDVLKQLKKPKSKGNVRATNLSEIHFINKDDLLEIMETYPKFAKHFQETFTHAFDLNDTEEEGYYQQEEKTEKLHVAAMARQALKMPILASWHRSSKKSRPESYELQSTCPGNSNKAAHRPHMNGHIHPCTLNKKMSVSADHVPTANRCAQKVNCIEDYDSLIPAITISSVNSNDQLQQHQQSRETAILEAKILTLENKIDNMERKLDLKLETLLGMFHELRLNNNIATEEQHEDARKNSMDVETDVNKSTIVDDGLNDIICNKFGSIKMNQPEEESLLLRDTDI